MAGTAHNRRGGGDREERAAHLISVPRFTRAALLAFTLPRIDSRVVENWVSRGVLEWKQQFVFGDAKWFREVAATVEANERHRPQDRLYTGGDVVKVMTVQAISQSRLPLTLAADIIPLALEYAFHRILNPQDDLDPEDQRRAAVLVIANEDGVLEWHKGELSELAAVETFWRTIIDIHEIVTRYIRAVDPDLEL